LTGISIITDICPSEFVSQKQMPGKQRALVGGALNRTAVTPAWNQPTPTTLSAITGGFAMRVFLGMILGALFLVAGVYIYDSMSTSSVANGEVAQANRTIVNWDVAATDWHALKVRAHDDWIKLSSK
jgi:hypothetical protein